MWGKNHSVLLVAFLFSGSEFLSLFDLELRQIPGTKSTNRKIWNMTVAENGIAATNAILFFSTSSEICFDLTTAWIS